MKKQFFVIGTKDSVVVSVAGPFNMSEAMEAESAKRKRTSDIRFEIVHESKMGDTNA
jgi:hypothetical protein